MKNVNKSNRNSNSSIEYFFYLDQQELEQRIDDISRSCRSQVPEKRTIDRYSFDFKFISFSHTN